MCAAFHAACTQSSCIQMETNIGTSATSEKIPHAPHYAKENGGFLRIRGGREGTQICAYGENALARGARMKLPYKPQEVPETRREDYAVIACRVPLLCRRSCAPIKVTRLD